MPQEHVRSPGLLAVTIGAWYDPSNQANQTYYANMAHSIENLLFLDPWLTELMLMISSVEKISVTKQPRVKL